MSQTNKITLDAVQMSSMSWPQYKSLLGSGKAPVFLPVGALIL